MDVTISASVGYKSVNIPGDVQKIHDLLKRIPPDKGGPPASFNAQAPYSAAVTDVHIYNFQVKHFGAGHNADAVVNPGRQTLAKMNQSAGPATPGTGTGKPKWPEETPPRSVGDIVQWFVQDILPMREGSGIPLFDRGGKVLNHLRGEPADPNGICGSAANFVYQEYMSFGRKSTLNIGYILWKQDPFFTHVANVIMPVPGVYMYKRLGDDGILEAGTSPMQYPLVKSWTVLDLYFKKVSTVGQWWQSVSYLGWGNLYLDRDGVFINT
jgi:hypothetical protein